MDLRRVDLRKIGLGIDAATAVAAAILPGGLPALGLYEAYKKLTGGPAAGTIDAMNLIAGNIGYLYAQINLALTSCPPAFQVTLLPELTSIMSAFTNAQQAFEATPADQRSTAAAPAQTVSDLLAAFHTAQSVAAKMAAAGCTMAPTMTRWICDDGTLSPDGDFGKCATDWKKIALYTALGLGGVAAAVVAYKVVSD